MANDSRNRFFRDTVLRTSGEHRPEQEGDSGPDTYTALFSLTEDDLNWLDANCLTLQNNSWHSATPSALVHALIRSVGLNHLHLDKVSNEEELVDTVRQAVRESATNILDSSKEASIPARRSDVASSNRWHSQFKLTMPFPATLGVILLILSVVSASYVWQVALQRGESVQSAIAEMLEKPASPSGANHQASISALMPSPENKQSGVKESPLPFALASGGVLPTATPATLVHLVLPGETLSGIAEDYGVSVKELVDANQIDDANSLRIGDKLLIYRR